MTDLDKKGEQYRVAVTQGDIREIKRDVTNLAEKVGEVHAALIGSALVKDGGIVQRLKDCEDSLEVLQLKIAAAELEQSKKEFYIRVIWGLISFVIGTVFVEVLKYYFATKK